MTWNLFGQFFNFIVAAVLISRLIWLELQSNYRALIVFVTYDGLQGFIFLVLRHFATQGKEFVDYRLLWSVLTWISWGTEIWMVYALLIAILKHLPGILRFSLRVLNITFAIAACIALITVWPQYTASGVTFGVGWVGRFTALSFALERATAFGLLIAMVAILIFVLFFPIRVPRNLAAVSTGLCLMLFVRIGLILSEIYLPKFASPALGYLDQLVTVGCIGYWVFTLNKSGEEARVTLGRGWQTVPQDHLVRQLEAINAALLRSREQS